ncbi:DNA methyltransferase [Caulobacter sp. FWC2]|uniref:DNA-methyltransferase n=1 Tax=Caulobacter sp. FWC2 TaxID=69664 RepID=UPI000C15D56D|nr:DNA methyltransferase [Caulobacter sp. FWC2]PIB91276.1 site-specific DNA-methyltransferase [Caulobacter sp. FWC2]
MKSVTIHHGDSRDVLKGLADNSIDSVVTDPPYALVSIVKRFGGKNASAAKSEGASGVYKRASAGFMGQTWDTGETAFDPEFWVEVMRVLKPGGHLIAASATRTYHRLAVAIEDAGFEIRDMISWLYGSGFPKSHDVSKGIDKANGDARPVTGSRLSEGGRGGSTASVGQSLIDAGRVIEITAAASAASAASAAWEGWGTALKPACEPWVLARKPLGGTVAANVLEHGTGALNIDACRVEAPQGLTGGGSRHGSPLHMDRAAGINRVNERSEAHVAGRWPANVIHDGSDEVVDAFPDAPGQQGDLNPTGRARPTKTCLGDMAPPLASAARGDSGSAARFFYSAKADADDRLGSKHPTVKPIDLMRYLCRLVTPPGGVVLDPFAGSGSTGVAAMLEGFESILIEREAAYVADIERKVAFYRGEGRLAAQEKGRVGSESADALPLFANGTGEAA